MTPSVFPLNEEARFMADLVDNTCLHVRLTASDQAVVVHVAGAVDMASAAALRTELSAALAKAVPPAPIVVDLTATTFLGSVGLNELVTLHEKAGARGTPLRVVATERPVVRAFAVTGLDSVLTMCEDLDQALRA